MKTINYVIYLLIFIVISILIYSFVIENDDMKDEKIVLNDTFITLDVGQSKKIDVYVLNNDDAELSFKVLDDTIVSILEDKTIKALKKGDTSIIISYNSKKGVLTSKCDVSVRDNESSIINSISFPKDDLLLNMNTSYKLLYTLEPNVEPEDISFTSSNSDILSVDANGNVKGIKNGNAIVRVIVNKNIYKDLNVYVRENVQTDYIIVPTMVIVDKNISIMENEEKELNIITNPSNASKDVLNIKSYNEDILKYEKGKIKGIKSGNTLITIDGVGGIRESVNVEVKSKEIKVAGIRLTTNEEFWIGISETKHLPYEIYPSNATNQEVVLTSTNNNVSLLSNGNILGITRGTTQGYVDVTITTKDGGFSTKVTVRVRTGIDDSRITAPKNGVNKSCTGGNNEDKTFNSCFKTSHHLGMDGIMNNADISMSLGETKSIRVNIPSECGSLTRWTRRTADGQEDWSNYVEQSFGNYDNRGYTWIITAKKKGNVTLSQTVQYDSKSPSGICEGNVKSMLTLNISIR